MPLVKTKNLAIQLDDFSISNVSFEVEAGESLVIIGPSGEGKTVLLKMVAGLMQPDQGQVFIDGLDIYRSEPKEREFKMLQMGMLFQKNALFDSLTCAENVAFPLREVKKMKGQEVEDLVHAFLEAVGILHAKQLFPHEISGGMQKRLGIARALALGPKVVLYDDPTAGLDPITSRKIAQLLMELQMKNQSANIYVTNDMARAYQLGTRIAMVVDGEFILTGSEEETRSHKDPRVNQFIRGAQEGPLTQDF